LIAASIFPLKRNGAMRSNRKMTPTVMPVHLKNFALFHTYRVSAHLCAQEDTKDVKVHSEIAQGMNEFLTLGIEVRPKANMPIAKSGVSVISKWDVVKRQTLEN
jgi:hypothetical protein